MPATILDRIWEEHVVAREPGRPDLLYVDLHLVHEVTSPQAFEGLRLAGRSVRRPDRTLATMDHNVRTGDDTPEDPLSHQQLETLRTNCEEFVRSVSSCWCERGSSGVSSPVRTLWSIVASVRSGRRTLRPARRRPSKACGDVTSCTRWRST